MEPEKKKILVYASINIGNKLSKIIQTQKDKYYKILGLERWFNSSEHWLLLQKTHVQFPAPTQQFTTICNVS